MNKFFGLLLAVAFSLGSESFSQDENKFYSTISKDHKVIINEDYSVDYHIQEKLRVLHSEGWSHAIKNIEVTPRMKLVDFEAIVKDPLTGKVIKKFKAKDLKEKTHLDGINLYSDTKINSFIPSGISTPFEIEYKIHKTSKDNFFISPWNIVEYYYQKVSHAHLEVIYPNQIGLRYKITDIIDEAIVEEGDSITKISWTYGNFEAQQLFDKTNPAVILVPDQFRLDKYYSRMETWEKLGSFINMLNEGKGVLPARFKTIVHQMVEGVDDEFEKLSILYKYLQENYRYVAITLGVGGWEPRFAEDVINTKYGECKALTTLMKAMLEEVGIPSQYTLVYAGENHRELDEEFPQNLFNHAFLRVPIKDEVFWVESTSRTMPPGFSGNFTKDRKVLVITPEGGVLDHTPDFAESRFNAYQGDYSIAINQMGDGQIIGKTRFDGFPAIPFVESMFYAGEKELKINLIEALNANNLFLSSIKSERENIRNLPRVYADFEGFYQKYVQQTGKRMILPGNFLHLDLDMLKNGSFSSEESLEINLELPFEIESGGGEQYVEHEFFTFLIEARHENQKIMVKNRLEVTLPKDAEKELKAKTLAEIHKQTKRSIILKKL
ncbi:transglutaminase domain-containing protein [Arthrospiribacter ruber]|nr:DUF3857 domain-containing protein [Arthrospiribacter ruber]